MAVPFSARLYVTEALARQRKIALLAQGLTPEKKLLRIILLLLGIVIQDTEGDLPTLYCPTLCRLIHN